MFFEKAVVSFLNVIFICVECCVFSVFCNEAGVHLGSGFTYGPPSPWLFLVLLFILFLFSVSYVFRVCV